MEYKRNYIKDNELIWDKRSEDNDIWSSQSEVQKT